MSEFVIRRMTLDDVEAGAALQAAAFPPPFPEELLWSVDHLRTHVEKFPEGQFVAEAEGRVVGTCSSCLLTEENWQAHRPWEETVGSFFIHEHDPKGSTLYGLDITVHPNFRKLGIGRSFYQHRFDLVRALGITRYGTGCRLPDFQAYAEKYENFTPEEYAMCVVNGETTDRTLTPLLKMGLSFVMVVRDYMDDPESGNAAALLEWLP
jgi:ribosomal protein S18 acetylase RimI-like enzyme